MANPRIEELPDDADTTNSKAKVEDAGSDDSDNDSEPEAEAEGEGDASKCDSATSCYIFLPSLEWSFKQS